MNSVEKSNKLAIEICDNTKYRYLYGAKGEDYTKALVQKLAKALPNTYTASLTRLAMEDADKGYKGIDCSGFVCKILGIANTNSTGLCSGAVKTYPVDKKYAKPGMAIWRSGHVAYIGKDLKIYEASSTANDMKVSSFDTRAKSFTKLLVVKGSALASESTGSGKVEAPVSTATATTKTSGNSFPKGCAVYVTGKMYANANGTGNMVTKNHELMYVVGATAGAKYPYGVSTKKGGTRHGWVNAASMTKK